MISIQKNIVAHFNEHIYIFTFKMFFATNVLIDWEKFDSKYEIQIQSPSLREQKCKKIVLE